MAELSQGRCAQHLLCSLSVSGYGFALACTCSGQGTQVLTLLVQKD
jgi:hypothetical protein